VFSWYYNLPALLEIYMIAGGIVKLVAFIVLCRSRLKIFHIIYVTIVTFLGFQALDAIQGAAYYYLGFTSIFVALILMLGGSSQLTSIAGITQLIILSTKYKEKIALLAQEEDPEVFADKYVNFLIFFTLTRILANNDYCKALGKKTEELAIAKIALENALEQQKTFIFSFSHELRNPINSLLGNLQLVLQGETLSGKAAEMIGVAKVCGEILLHNINNVLDTGKHDIGKLEVNPVATQVHELFRRTWSIYSELLRQKKLQSHLRIDKSMPPAAKLDPHKLNQIMSNLIGNSIKFTEKGSVSVTAKWLRSGEISNKCFEPIPYDDVDEGIFEKEENLSTMNTSRFSEQRSRFLASCDETSRTENDQSINYPEQGSKGVLKIIVKDTGTGMKKESLEKLFQKFSQVSENISHRQIGTGLGLFITKEICMAMNGEIRAYSKIGIGTTFVVCIPTIALALNRGQRTNTMSVINQLAEKHLKALVADDSPFNVNLTCEYLSKFGTSVVSVAYNGHDAFMKYKACQIANAQLDVVILDIDMPIMDGRTVCDKIREYEREKGLRPVRILLISGNYDREQVDEYINPQKGHRANGFLRKPVSFSDFNRAVYSLIGN